MIRLITNIFVHDFWLKLFSFVLAVLIWFTVYFASQRENVSALPLTPQGERTFANLKVIVMSAAEDVRSVQVNPKEVEVTVQGDPKVLSALQAKHIHVTVDLTGIGAAHDLRKRIDVATPAGVTHRKVEPEEVQVVFPPRN